MWDSKGSADVPCSQQHHSYPRALQSSSKWTEPVIWACRLAEHTFGGELSGIRGAESFVQGTGLSSIREQQPSAGREPAGGQAPGLPQNPAQRKPPQLSQEQPTLIYLDETLETDTRDKDNWENAFLKSRKTSWISSNSPGERDLKSQVIFFEFSVLSKERKIAMSLIYRRKGASCTSENQLRIDPAAVNIHEGVS